MINKDDFVQFLIETGALRFGNFTTKSGRQTPYFINMGMFCTGAALAKLASFYAAASAEHFSGRVDNLFGPAYKGIPLCASTVVSLYREHSCDMSFTYNRKEAKDHGEGGILVGDCYQEGRNVLIVEDVITAGTSVRETVGLLSSYQNAHVIGLVVSVDRKERLDSGRSAIEEVHSEYGLDTCAIADIDDIIAFLSPAGRRRELGLDDSLMDRIFAYRERYGAAT
jgi:orotate phosphoribosyltransferase